MASHFRDYSIGVHALLSTFRTGISTVNKVVSAYREQDEAMVDAMKTTNLTKEEIRSLSIELQKINTRTAQNELLGLARIGGKLGKSHDFHREKIGIFTKKRYYISPHLILSFPEKS